MGQKNFRIAAVACLLTLGACGPTTNSLLAEIRDEPFNAIFAPITLTMGAVYDGIYHTTGITGQEISAGINGAHSAVSGVYNAMPQTSGGNNYRAPSGGGSGSGTVSSNGGYSQRGAFEECARVYQQAGRPDLAQQCANNANNMSSMRPVK